MKRTRWLMASVLVPAAATAAALAAPVASQAAHLALRTSGSKVIASSAKWREYPLPISGNASVYGISAPGRNDAWAVGATFGSTGKARAYVRAAHGPAVLPAVHPGDGAGCVPMQGDGSLLMHWNGARWARVAVPQVGDIGYVTVAGPADLSVAAACESLHWNGKTWAAASYAHVPNMQNFTLTGFAADGPRDGWLTGVVSGTNGFFTGYAERWNGSRWRRVQLPNLGADYGLSGVAALGPDNVWVGGWDANQHMILLHWNGRSWTLAPAPGTGYRMTEIYTVRAVAPGDVWTVGYGSRAVAPNIVRSPLIIHWTGHRWENTPAPAPPYHSEIYTIADDHGQLWAAGDTFTPAGDTYGMALLRWTGSRWTASPPPAAGEGAVSQLTAVPGGGLWGAGYISDASGLPRPVIARR
ncbi:MAG: hypothetical protein JOY82_06630 [Streptosporangiaceae bacterium]|nr:hypothetical protein [Streptosporangiaceae bacterium]MBV9854187.1 hypothetical protein [Streptosporangiaceae bacterium]